VTVVLGTNVVAALVASGLCQLRARVRLVRPMTLPAPVSRDADDDVVLATAVAGGAAVIVTGEDSTSSHRESSWRGSAPSVPQGRPPWSNGNRAHSAGSPRPCI
jgi:hypothetical protein